MKEYISDVDREQLLNTATIFGDFKLASGKQAVQKFDFDLITSDSKIYDTVTRCLAKCIRDYFDGYNGVLTVANGATRLGEPLSQALGISYLNSAYEIDEFGVKNFSIESMLGLNKVVIVDDVFTEGTNATKVALVAQELNIETLGICVVLDRSGITSPSIMGNIAVKSLIQQELS